jgi:hypothetical protein
MWSHFRDDIFFLQQTELVEISVHRQNLKRKWASIAVFKFFWRLGIPSRGWLMFAHQDSSQPADRRQDDFEEQQFVARPGEA